MSMRIVCTICTDSITNDFSAAPCGHTFHYTCLSQWLAHQKTCPQCRERCLPRNVIRLFIDDSTESLQADNNTLGPKELTEKLVLHQNLLKHKDQALSEARATLEQIREEVQAWQTQHNAVHKKLKAEKAANSTLKSQLEVLQYECELVEELKKETKQLREKLSTMEGIQKVLTSSQEEVDTLVKNYQSTSQLASFLAVLRRDYDALKASKASVRKEKDKLAQEITYLKRKVQSKGEELQSTRSQLSMMEADLHAAEKERDGLAKKVEMLERALESPGSKVALRRILESPMPDPSGRMVPADLGASPLFVSRKQEKEVVALEGRSGEPSTSSSHPVLKIGSKRQSEHPAVVLPNKVIKKEGSENFACGFNGMGGQSRFIVPVSFH
jgi:TRAF-interacting protein